MYLGRIDNMHSKRIFICCSDPNLNRPFGINKTHFYGFIKHRAVVNAIHIIVRPSV